jgi:hypothetical protein
MDLQIEKLLEKYWAGKTSPDEEKAIRKYFKNHSEESLEGLYFNQIKSKREIKPQNSFVHPGRRIRRAWLYAAAVIIIALLSVPFILQQEKPEDKFAVNDPKEAFEITKASLMMVSQGLNKGKTYSADELGKFDKAKTIIKEQ